MEGKILLRMYLKVKVLHSVVGYNETLKFYVKFICACAWFSEYLIFAFV